MRDFISHLDFVSGIPPVAAVTNDTPYVSAIVDMQGCEGAAFVMQTGTLSDADATFTILVEDGDDSALADNAAVVDDELNGTEALAGFTFAADNKIRKIGYRGGKRYARVTVTPALNTGNIFLAGIWVLNRNLQPAANPPA